MPNLTVNRLNATHLFVDAHCVYGGVLPLGLFRTPVVEENRAGKGRCVMLSQLWLGGLAAGQTNIQTASPERDADYGYWEKATPTAGQSPQRISPVLGRCGCAAAARQCRVSAQFEKTATDTKRHHHTKFSSFLCRLCLHRASEFSAKRTCGYRSRTSKNQGKKNVRDWGTQRAASATSNGSLAPFRMTPP